MASAGPSTGWHQNWNDEKIEHLKKKRICLCKHLHQDPNTVLPTCSTSVVGHSRSCIETGSDSPDQWWSRRPCHRESTDHSHKRRSSDLSPGAGNRSSQTSWINKNSCLTGTNTVRFSSNPLCIFLGLPSKYRVGGVGYVMISVVNWILPKWELYVWITLTREKKNVFRHLLSEVIGIVVRQINSHFAIVVFGLQVYGPDHIHPDQTLLGPTVWELSELTWRSSNTGVIWQRVHFEGALMVDKSVNICVL